MVGVPVNVPRCLMQSSDRVAKFNHVVNVTRRVCDIDVTLCLSDSSEVPVSARLFRASSSMESLLDAISRVDFDQSKPQELKSETEGILSKLCCFILTLQQTSIV